MHARAGYRNSPRGNTGDLNSLYVSANGIRLAYIVQLMTQ
jgi:hypothetical protein